MSREVGIPRDAHVTMYDPSMGGAVLMNESDFDDRTVTEALVTQHPELAQLVKWTVNTRSDAPYARQGGVFSRDRYVTPSNIFGQFDTARDALLNDDVVSTFAEQSEAMAFARMAFTAEDEDEEDIWNQIAFDIDLDSRVREMWRELICISQVYQVVWWGRKSYKVRGKSPDGVKRKKEFTDLIVPLGMTTLDPKKVVPVGNLMFNQEQLAYIADRTEVDMLDAAVLNDPQADPVSRQIIVAKYEPPDYERRNLARAGINAEWLYILNPRNVFRHTLTRSQFERFAEVRMRSLFEILDLKHQLRQMDRAFLVGATNWILLIKKGTEKHPAKPAEIMNLQSQVRTVAQVPILVGDHRLSVEIITPKTDAVLNSEKYSVLNSSLTSRLWQLFMVHGGQGMPRSDDSVKLGKVIARGLEARRGDLRRTVTRQVVAPCVEANDKFTCMPKLRFYPTHIQLDLDPAMIQLILDVRDHGDLSRESVLNELDFDQEDEARQREREKERYDKTFTPVQVPFDAPSKTAGQPGGTQPAGAGQPVKKATKALPAKQPAAKVPAAKSPAAKKAPTPRSAGRQGGGNRNGGGASGGSKSG